MAAPPRGWRSVKVIMKPGYGSETVMFPVYRMGGPMKGCNGTLKQKVRNRDILIHGCVMDCRSGSVIEMYQETGFDVVFIDREHTGLNSETILEHIRLSRALEIPCMVRVAEISYTELNRVMDQAPDGIYAPRIRTRQEVEEFVRLTKFPPHGVKGFGASTCPAGKFVGWQPAKRKQLEHFNDDFVRGIQIETKEALEHLDEILSVPGIDIAVVGNDDLTLGLGIPGQNDHPDYIEEVHRVIAACQRHGVLPGIACGDPEAVRFWENQGMRVFWAAADIVSMWTHTQKQMEAIRKCLKTS